MVRRNDGTVFFGSQERVWRVDPNGAVTDMGFGAWALARDASDNVYVATSKSTWDGKAYVPVQRAILRIERDGKLKMVSQLEAGVEGMAVDRKGAVYLLIAGTPRAYIDRVAPDGSRSQWTRLDRVSEHTNNWALNAFVVDSRGNLYLAGWGAVLKIDSANRTASAFAGREQDRLGTPRDGRGQEAELGAYVTRMTIDLNDNLYVAMHSSDSWLRKITPDAMVSTLAGGGDGGKRWVDYAVVSNELVDGDIRGQLLYPHSTMDVDALGNVYFLQCAVNALRRITPQGRVETLLRGRLNPPGW